MKRRAIANDDDETRALVRRLIRELQQQALAVMWARIDSLGTVAAITVRPPSETGAMTVSELTGWLRECADDIEQTTQGIKELGEEVDRIMSSKERNEPEAGEAGNEAMERPTIGIDAEGRWWTAELPTGDTDIYKFIKKAIEGWIEAVITPLFVMWVDEEFLLKGLAPNQTATSLLVAQATHRDNIPLIHGPVLITGRNGEHTTPLDPAVHHAIIENLKMLHRTQIAPPNLNS